MAAKRRSTKKRPSRKKASGGSAADRRRTADFLIAMSQHPELKRAWKRNPVGTMKRAGLSAKAQAALRSKDPEKVRKHLGSASPPGCFIILI